MYENMMRILIAMLGFVAGLLFTLTLIFVSKEAVNHERLPSQYPMAGLITEIDNDVFVITERNGNQWACFGAEDYEVGDLVACTMSDNGTVFVEDDIILDVRYCG